MKKHKKKAYRSPIEDMPALRYLTLTIEFAEADEGLPRSIDVPYLPYRPKERLSLPFRLSKVHPNDVALMPPLPDGTMEDALRRSSDQVRDLLLERQALDGPPGEVAEEWGK